MYPGSKHPTISLVTQHDATRKQDGGLCDLYPLLDFVLMNDFRGQEYIIRTGSESHKKDRIRT